VAPIILLVAPFAVIRSTVTAKSCIIGEGILFSLLFNDGDDDRSGNFEDWEDRLPWDQFD